MKDLIERQVAIDALDCINGTEEVLRSLPSAQPEQQHGRVFKGIVVEYPEYCIYPEYKGKPYFSIKYTEKGQSFIGYGTYNPEVLSEYLKEYFMPSAQPEPKEGEWIPVQRCQGDTQPDLECPFCNHRIGWWDMGRYCAGCGAKLKGGAG